MTEALISMVIALLIISTLSATITLAIKRLNALEEQTIAHGLMLDKMTDQQMPMQVIIHGKKFRVVSGKHFVSVKGEKYYEVSW
ncbi:hypothetical protein [Companilactobacillus versmoldensis]|uniref:hypothetical protein n=1 Tax=Companilactobacillus versmoldensis TaxID=194326 RepID=UPI000314D511|nr:hypothetical protein [Companilactobacillus versmoldensis]